MYTQTWSKYLPVLRILLKRSSANEQTFTVNTIDFTRAGAARKSGYKFSIIFNDGRAENGISQSALAKDLIDTLLEDDVVKDLFSHNNYNILMNSKFQISIKMLPKTVALS